MKQALIVHGTYGSPEGNWFPWLKKKLEKDGYKVYVPKFPTPENQSLSTWMQTLERTGMKFNEETILIGHSLGPAFILSVLEELNAPVKACFFVSGFIRLLGSLEFDCLNKSFIMKPMNWKKITSNSKAFYVINADNDPYVPLEKGEELAKFLQVPLTVMEKAGHMNTESGHTTFDKLYKLIKKAGL